MIELIYGALIVAAGGGGLLSWHLLGRVSRLEARIAALQESLQQLVRAGVVQPPARPPENEPDAVTAAPAAASAEPAGAAAQPDTARETPAAATPVEPPAPSFVDVALVHLQQHWMIWLGALCVALAGIFLVRFSIESGLLGPTARILLALATGATLHGVAEWLRRRAGEPHRALAGLVGAASITLYAAILAALRLYDMVSPGVAFALLAVIALLTMALALLHGPMVAIIGLLGAYAVPPLVSDGSGQFLIVLVYSLIVSAAAILLTRYVYRVWLWCGMLAGSLGWWLLSFSGADVGDYRGFYLAVLAYSMLAIPGFNWALAARPAEESPVRAPLLHRDGLVLNPLQVGVFLVLIAQGVSIWQADFSGYALVTWSALVVIALFCARAVTELAAAPWFSLLAQWLGWLACALDYHDGGWRLQLSAQEQQHFLLYAAGTSVLYSALGWWTSRGRDFSHLAFSLVVMAPLVWLALAYTLVTELSVDWRWSMLGIAFGGLYLFLSRRSLTGGREHLALWFILGGHFAYSLAVAMIFREATLTLALAAQVISLTWLRHRFDLKPLEWVIKGVLGVVLLRLTFNPWLLRYPADVHWSLFSYGGSLLCVYIALRRAAQDTALQQWLAAACAQLLVLFLAAETRYWLYDGEIFRREYGLLEAAINSSLWAGLGLAYHWRAAGARLLRPVYSVAARLLMLGAAVNQVLVLTALNPLWGVQAVGATPIFNILLLAYGLPAVLAALVYRYYAAAGRKPAAVVGGASLLMLVSLQVRHLWQGAVDIDLPTGDGELYTYSAVWLAMAVGGILYAGRRGSTDLYRAGMALLLAVVAKLFLVDMAGLEGLWRVASFMGLGLSLLGLAYLYQRQVQGASTDAEPGAG